MSRSRKGGYFITAVDMTPIPYLTSWRMIGRRQLLAEPKFLTRTSPIRVLSCAGILLVLGSPVRDGPRRMAQAASTFRIKCRPTEDNLKTVTSI